MYQKARKYFGEKLKIKKKREMVRLFAKNQENTIAELEATLEIQHNGRMKVWKIKLIK